MSLASQSTVNSSTTTPQINRADVDVTTTTNNPAFAPPTGLRSTTSTTGFILPAIWSFPPFFTLQPNPLTQAHQLLLWSELILAWARHDRVFIVNSDSLDGGGDVFWNRTIGRRLLPPAMKQVFAHMVKNGNAAADPPKQTSTYLLYWRKPEEWGQIIYDWVSDNGLTTSIMTLYEITDGDMSQSTDRDRLVQQKTKIDSQNFKIFPNPYFDARSIHLSSGVAPKYLGVMVKEVKEFGSFD